MGQGEPGTSATARHAESFLEGRYLRISGRSVYPKQQVNPKGEIHLQMDIWSYDGTRDALVFRQFDSLGFVTTYVLDKAASSSGRLVLVAEQLENVPSGWHARYSRRRTVLLSLTIITIGMMLSAVATGLYTLMAARGLTGIGVGAMMPTINTVVAEFANRKRRDFSVCVQGTGFPLGGALAAVFVYFASDLSWRWVFFAGGMFSLLLIPAVLAWMPESFEFLIERRPRNALKRLNHLLGKLGVPEVAELPAISRGVTLDGAARTLWRKLGAETATICATFFLLMFTFYFLTNWTPKLLTDYGLSTQMGVSGAVLMSIGGVVGDVVFAALVVRWPAYRVGPVFMIACFVTAVVFAFVPMQLEVLLSTALLLGFLLFGSMASLYAIVPTLYPAALRATGTGIALGLGRTGATVGPYVGGLLISMGWSREAYLIVMALPLLVCAALTRSLVRRVLEPAGRPLAADVSRT